MFLYQLYITYKSLASIKAKKLEIFRFFLDDQEISKHLRRIAVPVFGPGNKVIAAIGICGNPLTIPDEMIMPTGEFLKAEAAKLSEILKDKI